MERYGSEYVGYSFLTSFITQGQTFNLHGCGCGKSITKQMHPYFWICGNSSRPNTLFSQC